MISFLAVRRTGRRIAGRGAAIWPSAGILGTALLLTLGCEDNSTTGPKANGLIVESQELTPSGGSCKLKVTLVNHTGADLSGQIAYQLLDAQKNIIGAATVFPTVPDGTRRTATSDFLLADSDGHRLACADIVAVQLLPVGTSVPILAN
jgi:hypothetical protein